MIAERSRGQKCFQSDYEQSPLAPIISEDLNRFIIVINEIFLLRYSSLSVLQLRQRTTNFLKVIEYSEVASQSLASCSIFFLNGEHISDLCPINVLREHPSSHRRQSQPSSRAFNRSHYLKSHPLSHKSNFPH